MLGEQEQRTCESCTKTQTTPGVGLTPLIQEEYETKLESLQELISGSKSMSFDNLQAASSTSLPITRGVIEALRDEPDQDILARRLASEVALASVLEKALLLQRTLLTGRMEPNVAANEMAQEAVTQESNILDREINNLKTELELRRELANNSRCRSSSATAPGLRVRVVCTRAIPSPIASMNCSARNREEAIHDPGPGFACGGCSIAVSASRCCGRSCCLLWRSPST